MKKYVLASKNKHKADEIKEILGENFEIQTMDGAGIGNLEIIEDGSTFEENAEKKAIEVFKATGLPTIADDSGLCVDALSGKPGVFTARFAGENATDDENIDKLLLEMSEVNEENRTAKFVCVIAVIDKNISENTQFFRGECNGYITKKRAGTSGFGYDPIFYYPEKQCTLSELGSNEKNKISHRYKALKKFAESI